MEQKFTFDIGVATHPGQKRPVNEDALLPWVPTESQQLRERGALFIVADGMGAYGHGAVAAEKVIQYTKDNYYLAGQPIRQAVEQANVQIYQYAQDHPENEGMGTTIVGVLCHPDGRFQAFNVGDSRAYLLRNGQIVQISNDHSVVARRVEKEGMSWAEAAKLGKTNQLTRSIGRKPAVEIEVKPVESFGPGDVFLLCSDGLWRDVTSEEIQQYVTAAATAQDAATQLVNLSNSRGGADNITVLVVRCAGHGAQKLTSMPAWATVPVSFDEPSAAAKAATKTPTGKSNVRLTYGLMGLGALVVLALVLVLIFSSKTDVATTSAAIDQPALISTKVATSTPLPADTFTPTPVTSDFKYDSLEITTDNDARFPQVNDVALEWKQPQGASALGANEEYRVWVSYQGMDQPMLLTATEPQISLPRETFFPNNQAISKDGKYEWAVAVVMILPDQTFKEISRRTSPPYTFYWMSDPPTRVPRSSVIPPTVIPQVTLMPISQTLPSCPTGQFWDPIMNRCRNTGGGGGTSPTCPNGKQPRPDGTCPK